MLKVLRDKERAMQLFCEQESKRPETVVHSFPQMGDAGVAPQRRRVRACTSRTDGVPGFTSAYFRNLARAIYLNQHATATSTDQYQIYRQTVHPLA